MRITNYETDGNESLPDTGTANLPNLPPDHHTPDRPEQDYNPEDRTLQITSIAPLDLPSEDKNISTVPYIPHLSLAKSVQPFSEPGKPRTSTNEKSKQLFDGDPSWESFDYLDDPPNTHHGIFPSSVKLIWHRRRISKTFYLVCEGEKMDFI